MQNSELLINETITKAMISEYKNTIIVSTQTGKLITLNWHGDCCAHCYIENISGSENLINSKIIKIEDKEWVSIKDSSDEVIESMGSTIYTSKGIVDIETRVEHNGYYGGYIEIEEIKEDKLYDLGVSSQYDDLFDF